MAEWNDGGKPKGRWDHDGPKSDAENREIQRGIDATMREVIKDRYNPWSFGSQADPPTPRGTGWAPESAITPPMGQDAIKNLCDTFQPHGLTNSQHPLAKIVEEVVARFKAQGQEEKDKRES